MRLKTYRAKSMPEALAAVKKDLGKEAVILHTRAIKRGAIFGWGGRTVIEITASDDPRALAPRDVRRLNRASAGGGGSGLGGESRSPNRPAGSGAGMGAGVGLGVARAYGAGTSDAPAGGVKSRAPMAGVTFEPSGAGAGRGAGVGATRPAPTERPAPEGPAATLLPVADTGAAREVARRALDPSAARDVHAELADIKRLVGQVLQSNVAQARRGTGADGRTNVGEGGGGLATAMPDAMLKHYCRLIEAEVARELADALVGEVQRELNHAELADEGIVRQAMLRKLESLLPEADAGLLPTSGSARPQVIALVGPTGVGKTTTVAKLAAAYKLRYSKKVALITCDTYRIAAVDQLRTYATIIGVPLKVVLTPEEMRQAVGSLSGHDAILIDTAGRSPSDGSRLSELAQFLAAAQPTQTHLVLSSVVSEASMMRTAERFAALAPSRVIFTKLDEAVHFGVLVNVARRLSVKLSYVTTGQEVPDDIEPGRPDRLARLVLDGAAA